MNAKNVIWGLVLVLIGVLFILKNMDIIYFSWYGIWKLWPMVLVLIGVAILPVKSGIKIALAIITLVIAAIILISFQTSREPGHNWWFGSKNDREEWTDEPSVIDQQISEVYDSAITQAELKFDAAAGNFRINETTGNLFDFSRDGNVGRYNYSIKELGEKREIRIELEEGRFRNIDLKNNVSMKLNPGPVWDLQVDVGAASLDLDLSPFKVGKLDINGGASSINLKLGNLQEQSEISINSGASSVKIEVPKELACEIRTSTVMVSKDLQGFNKVGDGTYVTENFSDSDKNIIIKIDAAVSSLEVDRY
jgi:hypothetical protein